MTIASLSPLAQRLPATPGIRVPDAAWLDFFRALPKAELHCHLLGAVRAQTFADLVAKNRAPIPAADIEAFYTRGEKPIGVLRVLRALDQHVLVEPGDLYRITFEYLEDVAAHQVRYCEFFWNPTGTVQVSGIPYPQAQDAIVAAIRDAEAQLGVVARLIPSIDREASPEAAVEMVEMVAAHRVDEVVGIGIDYRENDRPPEMFWKAYARARQAGLRCTAHAGEFGMHWRNVETALDLLHCDRIDHGYTIVDNPALMARCVERGMVFTVVPSNSYYMRTLEPHNWAREHPIRAMLAAGLKLHPNSDDPTLHQINPSEVWQVMYSYFGVEPAQLRELMLNGLDGAWIDASTRADWRRSWSAEFDALLPPAPNVAAG